jgi:hypothetical protein
MCLPCYTPDRPIPPPVRANCPRDSKYLIKKALSTMIRAIFNVESKIHPDFRLLQGSASQRDGAARLQRLQCGVYQRQRLEPVAAAGLRRRATGERVDKMVELEPVRLSVAFEEARQRLLADDPLGTGKGDRAQGNIAPRRGANAPGRNRGSSCRGTSRPRRAHRRSAAGWDRGS